MESKENMRNIKLVSVVVPVYNQEKYLDTSVPSILNQTYPDVEVVLVDDGSTDKSGTMCDEYAKLNDNVQVIHQKKRRAWSCRCNGSVACTGSICLLC